MKFRREGKLIQCAVVGCREYPGHSLYHRSFCDLHHEAFRREIAKRYYEEFRKALRKQGYSGEIRLVAANASFPASENCYVVGCTGRVTGGAGNLFEPFKQPGYVYLCQQHFDLEQELVKRNLGSRLIWERTQRPRERKDPEHLKRREAVNELCGKYHDQPNYTEKVCKELTQRRIPMLPSWISKLAQRDRIEKCDWITAYSDSSGRKLISRYISKHRS